MKEETRQKQTTNNIPYNADEGQVIVHLQLERSAAVARTSVSLVGNHAAGADHVLGYLVVERFVAQVLIYNGYVGLVETRLGVLPVAFGPKTSHSGNVVGHNGHARLVTDGPHMAEGGVETERSIDLYQGDVVVESGRNKIRMQHNLADAPHLGAIHEIQIVRASDHSCRRLLVVETMRSRHYPRRADQAAPAGMLVILVTEPVGFFTLQRHHPSGGCVISIID